MYAYLDHIHRYNPIYNAIVSMRGDEELIDQAQLADTALDKNDYWGWMHGMPHAVKDLADAKGLETSKGSQILEGTIAKEDSLHIARIREQGAIFIGKTNTSEFGLGSQSYNGVHGTTKNAYNPELTAGGSSGGAAVGMATQMLPIADGSDMMGSLRNPAAFNNVIGFRPSQGRVPRVPSNDLYYQELGTDGPMGRNVEDTIRLFGTIAGYGSQDPLSLRDEVPAFEAFRKTDLKDVRIGWLGNYDGYLTTEPGVLDLCEQSLKKLSKHGVIVENCMTGYDMYRLWRTWLTLRHWALREKQEYYEDPKQKEFLKPEIIWEIEGSFNLTTSQISEAGAARADWSQAINKLFDLYDFLVLPSAQVFPFSADVHWPDSINGQTMDTYHRWMEVTTGATLAGLPAVNLPVGFDNQSRSMGIQVLGPMGQDQKVLEFAMAYEAATDFLDHRPLLKESIKVLSI
tara:strand:+ start:1577 stop:2950 length:1374 start_codon:yes stop_codon:yes gene_type:complete